MVALAVTESYASVEEADEYLERNATWNAASEDLKTDALLFARYYIDLNFSCIDLTDELVVPDALKYATSILAADYVSDTTIFNSGSSLKRELVKADVVTVEQEFFAGKSYKPPSLALVKGILIGTCTYTNTSPFLLRG